MKMFNLLLLIFTFLLSGCFSEETNNKEKTELSSKKVKPVNLTPEDVIAEMYKAIQSKDYKKLHDLATDEDKKYRELDTSLKNMSIYADLYSKIKYKIIDSNITNKEAFFKVEDTIPDVKNIMDSLFKQALKGASKAELEKAAIEAILSSKEFPTTIQIRSIHLLKENAKWKIFNNWKSDNFSNKLFEANMAYYDDREKAKKLYKEIVETNIKDKEVDYVVEAKSKYEYLSQMDEYKSKVKILDFEARYHETYRGRTAGVNFKLKNIGKKTLTKVKVIVYFKDKSGNIITEEDYHPVLVTKYGYGLDNKPLKAGYIWQQEKNKFYKANVPSEWKTGSADIKIAEVEFEYNPFDKDI